MSNLSPLEREGMSFIGKERLTVSRNPIESENIDPNIPNSDFANKSLLSSSDEDYYEGSPKKIKKPFNNLSESPILDLKPAALFRSTNSFNVSLLEFERGVHIEGSDQNLQQKCTKFKPNVLSSLNCKSQLTDSNESHVNMSYDIIVQEKNNEISFWKKKVNACEIKLAAETSKRDKVETLTKENSRLQSLIQEKDLEISKLRASISDSDFENKNMLLFENDQCTILRYKESLEDRDREISRLEYTIQQLQLRLDQREEQLDRLSTYVVENPRDDIAVFENVFRRSRAKTQQKKFKSEIRTLNLLQSIAENERERDNKILSDKISGLEALVTEYNKLLREKVSTLMSLAERPTEISTELKRVISEIESDRVGMLSTESSKIDPRVSLLSGCSEQKNLQILCSKESINLQFLAGF